MKYKLAVLLAALLCAGASVPTTSSAARVIISIGDHAYYNHGPWYYEGRVRWYWVPGHWAWRHHHRVWIHGFYVRR